MPSSWWVEAVIVTWNCWNSGAFMILLMVSMILVILCSGCEILNSCKSLILRESEVKFSGKEASRQNSTGK